MIKDLDKYKNSNLEYEFPLGDLLVDFDKHINKYFWQKKKNHNELTAIYVKIFNRIHLSETDIKII